MGTTRPITFYVENNVKVKVQLKWNLSFIIKFTGGKYTSENYKGTVRVNNIGSYSIKIDWAIVASDSFLPAPPYTIRETILGF